MYNRITLTFFPPQASYLDQTEKITDIFMIRDIFHIGTFYRPPRHS